MSYSIVSCILSEVTEALRYAANFNRFNRTKCLDLVSIIEVSERNSRIVARSSGAVTKKLMNHKHGNSTSPWKYIFLMQNVLQQRLSQLCGTVKGRNSSELKLLSLCASCLLIVALDCWRIQKQDPGCDASECIKRIKKQKHEQRCPPEQRHIFPICTQNDKKTVNLSIYLFLSKISFFSFQNYIHMFLH